MRKIYRRSPLQAVIEDFREKELGGRVFTCMTGSAPTAPEVVDFLRDAMIVPIYEGYGSTECGEPSPEIVLHSLELLHRPRLAAVWSCTGFGWVDNTVLLADGMEAVIYLCMALRWCGVSALLHMVPRPSCMCRRGQEACMPPVIQRCFLDK